MIAMAKFDYWMNLEKAVSNCSCLSNCEEVCTYSARQNGFSFSCVNPLCALWGITQPGKNPFAGPCSIIDTG